MIKETGLTAHVVRLGRRLQNKLAEDGVPAMRPCEITEPILHLHFSNFRSSSWRVKAIAGSKPTSYLFIKQCTANTLIQRVA